MGDILKAIVGIALVVLAPGIGAALAGSTFAAGMTLGMAGLSGAALAIGIGAVVVGASLAGSAVNDIAADSMGDVASYAGQKLQTQKSNTNPVPIVYGDNKLAGNVIWHTANSAENSDNDTNGKNRDYWAIIVIAQGQLDNESAINKMWANNDLLNMVQSGFPQTHTDTYTHANIQYSGAGVNLGDIGFPKNTAGNLKAGSSMMNILAESHLTLSNNNTAAHRGGLLDNNASSYWSPQSTQNFWIKVDLGVVGTVSSMTFQPIGSYQQVSWNVKMQYSDDGTNWTNTGNSGSGHYWTDVTPYQFVTLNNTHTNGHRYWRLYFNSLYDYDPSYGMAYVAKFTINSSIVINEFIPEDVTFLAVHQVFNGDESKNTMLKNITIQTLGKSMRVFNATSYTATTTRDGNPVNILADLLIDGLKVDESDLDVASFYAAQEMVNSYGLHGGLVLFQQANIQGYIQEALAMMRGSLTYSDGKWKLYADLAHSTPIKTLTEDDIVVNTLSASHPGNDQIFNKLTFKYVDSEQEWLSGSVVAQDTTLETDNFDGQRITKSVEAKGIINAADAAKLAKSILNTTRYTEDDSGSRLKITPLVVSFATTVKHCDLEVSDKITIQHSIFDRDRHFIILSIQTDQSGLISITARETCATHYVDEVGNNIYT